MAVLVFHYFDGPLAPSGYHFEAGRHGVDVFFVISGFIMGTVAREEAPALFLFRRLTRIFPLYWIATAVAIGCYWAFDGMHPSGTELVRSLALWPHYSEAHPLEIWPVLVPGWTLTYEIYFYALFAIGIVARRVTLIPVALITAAVLLGLAFAPQSAPLRVATDPILVEFAGGLVIAELAHSRPQWLWRAALALSLGAIVLLAIRPWQSAIGPLAALIVTGTVWNDLRTASVHRPRSTFGQIGNASYSIYLFHALIIYVFEMLVAPITSRGPWDWLLTVVAIALALALSLLLHRWIERPLLRVMQGTAERRPQNGKLQPA